MIRIIGFVDTLPAAAAYHTKFKAQFEQVDDVHGLTAWPGEHGEPGEWKSARNLVARIQALVTAETEANDPRVYVLEPGEVIPWDRTDPGGWDRFVVALAAGPGASLIAGAGAVPFVVGQVLHFTPANYWTVANFGPVPLVALVVDLHAVSDLPGSPPQADS